jgi:hypothetical protein
MSTIHLGPVNMINALEIRIDSSGRPFLTISYDGKIKFNREDYPELTADDFAKNFVDTVEKFIMPYVPVTYTDHVSKQELRKWCEEIKYRLYTSNSLGTAIAKGATETAQGIIDQFCEEK